MPSSVSTSGPQGTSSAGISGQPSVPGGTGSDHVTPLSVDSAMPISAVTSSRPVCPIQLRDQPVLGGSEHGVPVVGSLPSFSGRVSGELQLRPLSLDRTN